MAEDFDLTMTAVFYPFSITAIQSIVERRSSDNLINTFPCTAAPVVYRPPPSSCIAEKAADVVMQVPMARNASMIQRKGHTSDEELEELDDPLACIIENVPRSPSVSNAKQNSVTTNNSMFKRYDLLRQVWSAGMWVFEAPSHILVYKEKS